MSVSPLAPDGATGLSDSALVAVDVGLPATTAIALDDTYAINGHQQLGASVLANDTDAGGATLSAVLVQGPAHGMLNLGTDGLFTYSPDRSFEGVDTFTYLANNGQADSSAATVSISVTGVNDPVNDPPAAATDEYRVDENQTLSVPGSGVLANDSDINGDPLHAVLVTAPRSGLLVLGSDGSFDYTPYPGFFGTDAFSYLANDGQAGSAAATVTIAVDEVNEAPAAADDSYSTPQDQPLAVPAGGVLENDTDADGDTLAAVLVQGPASGTLVLNPDGSFQYTPNAGFSGTDAFSYLANDGQADSVAATVTITVDAANAAPVAADDSYSTLQDQPLAVPAGGVLANDTDADGDPLSAVLLQGPANGTLVLNLDGSFQYTPNAGFSGTDAFSYLANDAQANSAPATVTITVDEVNEAPAAADDSYATLQDQPLAVPAGGVLANDTDADGDTLAAVLVQGPASGTLVLNPDGSFQYTPNAGFSGTDTFRYLANDGQADSAATMVTIAVDPRDATPAPELVIHLEVSGSPFGPETGPIWSGSTFWVSAYVQDLREVPQGVVGGAMDLEFDADRLTATGNVVYGAQFTDYRQGTVDRASGVIDEAGALTTEAGVGADSPAAFVAWEFRRSGAGTPNDPNSQVVFAAGPGEGTATILPANFALVGVGTAVDWANVEFDQADLNLYLGDFNSDGAVNHCDLALWIPHVNSSPEFGNFQAKFDLSGDSRVDLADLAILMPRMYRPVLGDSQSAPSGDPLDLEGLAQDLLERSTALRDRLGRHRAAEVSIAPSQRIGEQPWRAGSEWSGAVSSLRGFGRHTRSQMAAIDRVMQDS